MTDKPKAGFVSTPYDPSMDVTDEPFDSGWMPPLPMTDKNGPTLPPLPDPDPQACTGNAIDGWEGAFDAEQMQAYAQAAVAAERAKWIDVEVSGVTTLSTHGKARAANSGELPLVAPTVERDFEAIFDRYLESTRDGRQVSLSGKHFGYSEEEYQAAKFTFDAAHPPVPVAEPVAHADFDSIIRYWCSHINESGECTFTATGIREFAKAMCTVAPVASEPRCLGDPGECAYNGACMYACGRSNPPVAPVASTQAKFFDKYALGSKLTPSCFVCGEQLIAPAAVEHMEVAGIVCCRRCKTASDQAKVAPVASENVADTLAILEARDLGIAEFHAMQLSLAKLIRKLDARHKLDVKLYGELGAEWREAYDKLDAERPLEAHLRSKG